MSRRKPRRESREPACITADAQSVNAVLLHLAAAVVKRKETFLWVQRDVSFSFRRLLFELKETASRRLPLGSADLPPSSKD